MVLKFHPLRHAAMQTMAVQKQMIQKRCEHSNNVIDFRASLMLPVLGNN